MMARLRKFRDALTPFHRDQRGESSTMSNVMMLAIAAIVVVALVTFGGNFLNWLNKSQDDIMNDGKNLGTTIEKKE